MYRLFLSAVAIIAASFVLQARAESIEDLQLVNETAQPLTRALAAAIASGGNIGHDSTNVTTPNTVISDTQTDIVTQNTVISDTQSDIVTQNSIISDTQSAVVTQNTVITNEEHPSVDSSDDTQLPQPQMK